MTEIHVGYSPTVSALNSRPLRALARDHLVVTITILGGFGVGLAAAMVAATQDPLVAILIAGGVALLLLSLRWPLLALYVFVALIPVEEIVNIGGLGTLSRWAGIAFAVVWVGTRVGRIVPGALPLAAWLYGGWALLSVTWALDTSTTMAQLQTLVQLVLIGFLIADVVIDDPTVIRPLLWTYSVSAAATAGLGLVLYLMGGGIAEGGRVAALANQNPAQFATILLPALIFSLYQVLEGRRVLIGSVIAALCTASIALSGTRSVWLGATVVLFLLVLPRLGVRRAIAAFAVLGVLVLITAQIPGVAGLVVDRTLTATSSGGAGRTDIWSIGLRIISSSPVLGVGYANFPVAYISELARSTLGVVPAGGATGSHSILFGTAGELGLVGLVLLGLFLGPLMLRRGWGPDGAVVHAILVSLMIDALFIDIIGNRKQVWVAIGMAAGLAYLAKQAERRASKSVTPAADLVTFAQHPARPRAPAFRGVEPGADW